MLRRRCYINERIHAFQNYVYLFVNQWTHETCKIEYNTVE